MNNTGYIGLRYDGFNNTVVNNFVEYSLMTLDDGGCIYAYGSDSSHHNVHNNICGHAFGSNSRIFQYNNITC